ASLQVGVITVACAITLRVLLGLVSGYTGGWVDDVVMRVVDAVQAFPGLILALAITAALGPSIGNAMIAIGIVATPGIARLTRGQTLSVRERDFVAAARVLGALPRQPRPVRPPPARPPARRRPAARPGAAASSS